MNRKYVRFQNTPNIIDTHSDSDEGEIESISNEDKWDVERSSQPSTSPYLSPSFSLYTTTNKSLAYTQEPHLTTSQAMNISVKHTGAPSISSLKRPHIPHLDFSNIARYSPKPVLVDSKSGSMTMPSPLPPPKLFVDTFNIPPLYYTSLSTCYF